MKEITMVLMTCGEETEGECLAAIEPFRDQIEFFEVRNVYPQIRALNYMIDGVWTDYFVPLDADFVLNPDALRRIVCALDAVRDDPSWHSILFPLWDTLTSRRILALKLLRTSVMKEHPFKESATPDVEHFSRLTEAGYSCIDSHLEEEPIGKHVIRGAHFCYHKYRDVYLTYRSHGRTWDAGVFESEGNLGARAQAHFDFFFYRWVMTGNKDYLWCIAGMVDGLISEVDHKSKSLKPSELKIHANQAVFGFMEWKDAALF
jgi:hypothetical protein